MKQKVESRGNYYLNANFPSNPTLAYFSTLSSIKNLTLSDSARDKANQWMVSRINGNLETVFKRGFKDILADALLY